MDIKNISIGRKLGELREKNHLSKQQLAEIIGCDPSVLSKVENGQRKKVENYVELYIKALKCDPIIADEITRIIKIAVPDTSALLFNPRLIEELLENYDKVVIPDVIIKELQVIKDKKQGKRSRIAWENLKIISEEKSIIRFPCNEKFKEKNDMKIIEASKKASDCYGSSVDIITKDIDYSALLKGEKNVKAVFVKDFMQIHHNITNMLGLDKLDKTFPDDYSNFTIPEDVDVNEYLPNGKTLIISAIRNNKISKRKKKKKIKWLIENGADVNKRERSNKYFPALTQTIQMNDYEMFIFLLKECDANPNIGNKNPFSTNYLRMQNEGNMPLMVAAYHGREEFVKALCKDKRTSINQQDSNGFTALIKASFKQYKNCCRILLQAGADTKIVDNDDLTAMDRFDYVANYVYEKEHKND